MQFFFPIDDKLQTIVAHTVENPEAGDYYGTTIGPSLYLVKDDGVYLMSASKKALLADPATAGSDDAKNLVAYATGHGTGTWLPGDDFGEPLDLGFFIDAVASSATHLKVTVTETTIAVETTCHR
jgi:hypothetical protein